MLGGPGNIGTLAAKKRKKIVAAAGAPASGLSRSGTSDSNHVHALSSLNSVFAIPNIDYVVIAQEDGGTFGNTGNDDDTNYSVKDITFTTGNSIGHTIFLGVRIRLNQATYHNDFSLGALQVHSPSAIVFSAGQANPPGGTSTNVNVTFATTDDIRPTTDSNADTNPHLLTYHFVDANSSTATANGRWGRGDHTPSTFTGPSKGISIDFQDGTTALPAAGEAVVAQDSSRDFMFVESSGSDENGYTWLRIPNVSLAKNTAHKLVIAYHFSIAYDDTPLEGDADENVYLYVKTN